MPPPEQQVPRDPANQPRVNNTNISWSHDKLCSSSTKRLNDRHLHYEEPASLWHFEETTELKQLPTGFKRKFKNSFMFRTNAPMGLVCYGTRIWIQNKNTRSSSTLIHFSKEQDHAILSSKKEEIRILKEKGEVPTSEDTYSQVHTPLGEEKSTTVLSRKENKAV